MSDVKTAIVSEFPDCDICKIEGKEPPEPAEYDAMSTYGSWGYMCEPHYQTHGVKPLGLGRGQKLVLETPEPQPRKDKAAELCKRCAKDCEPDSWNKSTGRYRVLDNPMQIEVMLSLGLFCEEI